MLADNVSKENVYATPTSEGIDRAIKKLNTIKDQIIWWNSGSEPIDMLKNNEVVMTSAWNGRVFNAEVIDEQNISVVWDGQIYEMDYWSIIKGSSNVDLALDFIRYASEAENQANFTKYLPYSPTRKSALEFVGQHLETGIDMNQYLPTHPDNLVNAINKNNEWWSNNSNLISIFDTWIESGITINVLNDNTTESGGTALFTVKLDSQPTANVTIPISSDDVSEGTVSISNLTFTSTNWTSEQTVTVTGVDDSVVDDNVTYSVQLGMSSSNDSIYEGFTQS